MSARFQKRIEDFVCENCGHHVKGYGFTNHCPQCFYSKHVDVNPGDRQESCGGLMPAIAIEYKHGQYYILQRCVRCGFQRRNKVQDEDNFDNLIKLQKQITEHIVKK